MKFIFPQNYDFKNKLLGIIDYSTLLFNLIWYLLVFTFVYFLFFSSTIKIFIFIVLCFPLLLFSISGFNGENILYVFSYIIKFISKNKLLLFQKKDIC